MAVHLYVDMKKIVSMRHVQICGIEVSYNMTYLMKYPDNSHICLDICQCIIRKL